MVADCLWDFEWFIKPMKRKLQTKSLGTWKQYVKYLITKNPGVPLKKLLSGYSRSEFDRFKKNPKIFV